jgi:hypothetical protein
MYLLVIPRNHTNPTLKVSIWILLLGKCLVIFKPISRVLLHFMSEANMSMTIGIRITVGMNIMNDKGNAREVNCKRT